MDIAVCRGSHLLRYFVYHLALNLLSLTIFFDVWQSPCHFDGEVGTLFDGSGLR